MTKNSSQHTLGTKKAVWGGVPKEFPTRVARRHAERALKKQLLREEKLRIKQEGGGA